MTLPDFVDALVWLALAYLVTIAMILLIRPFVARFAGTNWAYALWGVLLVPPLGAFAPSPITDSLRVWNFPSMDFSSADGIAVALLTIWVFGALAIGSICAWRSFQVHRKFKDSFGTLSAGQMSQVERSCSRANVFPAPRTVLSSCGCSPVVMNGLVPTLVLPDDFFQRYSEFERNLILHHELVHLRRFDLVWNVMFRGLRCLLWFVPFIKDCERLFRFDQERSCDHIVVCDEPRNSRADYARALLKTVIPPSSGVGIAGFRNTRHELVVRTALLSTHRRTPARSIVGAIALATCVFLTVSVSANPNVFPDETVSSSGWCSIYGRLGL